MTDTFPLGSTKEVSHGGKKTRAISARVQGANRRAGESRAPGSLARKFEPSQQTIRNWVKQADLDEGRRSDGLTTEARKEMRELKREVKRLRMERDILKKAAAGSRGRANRSLAGVCVHEGVPGRVSACSHVPGAGAYYDWLRRAPSAQARRNAELKIRIKAIWRDSDETYGCPRSTRRFV